MANTALGPDPTTTVRRVPAVGEQAPDFTLVDTELAEFGLSDLTGRKVLNIFPSIGTGVCQASVRTFDELAAGLDAHRREHLGGPAVRARRASAPPRASTASRSARPSAPRSPRTTACACSAPSSRACSARSRSWCSTRTTSVLLHQRVARRSASEPDYDAAVAAARLTRSSGSEVEPPAQRAAQRPSRLSGVRPGPRRRSASRTTPARARSRRPRPSARTAWARTAGALVPGQRGGPSPDPADLVAGADLEAHLGRSPVRVAEAVDHGRARLDSTQTCSSPRAPRCGASGRPRTPGRARPLRRRTRAGQVGQLREVLFAGRRPPAARRRPSPRGPPEMADQLLDERGDGRGEVPRRRAGWPPGQPYPDARTLASWP